MDEDEGQEAKKDIMVSFANTSSDPGTMMIVNFDAGFTLTAVEWPGRSLNVTSSAYFNRFYHSIIVFTNIFDILFRQRVTWSCRCICCSLFFALSCDQTDWLLNYYRYFFVIFTRNHTRFNYLSQNQKEQAQEQGRTIHQLDYEYLIKLGIQ